MSKCINSFKGYYNFLSNMYECDIMFCGRKFSCVENFFQAYKCKTIEEFNKFKGINGYDSKYLGRRVTLREDWNDIRVNVMRKALYLKFNQNEELRYKLFGTRGYELIEGNNHGDCYWGVCKGVGENMLGKLLMEVRDNLYEKEERYK